MQLGPNGTFQYPPLATSTNNSTPSTVNSQTNPFLGHGNPDYRNRNETGWFKDFANKLTTGNLTEEEINYAKYTGWLEPTKPQQPAYTGGGYQGYRRGHGGGRGGGGTKQVAAKQPSLPAFSTGSGFNGLVNWRV
jgi:hypothetical protein